MPQFCKGSTGEGELLRLHAPPVSSNATCTFCLVLTWEMSLGHNYFPPKLIFNGLYFQVRPLLSGPRNHFHVSFLSGPAHRSTSEGLTLGKCQCNPSPLARKLKEKEGFTKSCSALSAAEERLPWPRRIQAQPRASPLKPVSCWSCMFFFFSREKYF